MPKQRNHLDFQKTAELQNAVLGSGTVSVRGEIARNDTDNRWELFIPNTLEKIAHLSDIENLANSTVASGNLNDTDVTILELKNADDSVISSIDLSPAVESDLSAIDSGSLDGATGIVTFTREDSTTFTLDLSEILPIGVVDALDSTSTEESLSANQGRVLSERIESDVIPVVNAKADQDDVQAAITQLDKDRMLEERVVNTNGVSIYNVPTQYTPTLVCSMRVFDENGEEVEGVQVGTTAQARIQPNIAGAYTIIVEYKFDPAQANTDVTLGNPQQVPFNPENGFIYHQGIFGTHSSQARFVTTRTYSTSHSALVGKKISVNGTNSDGTFTITGIVGTTAGGVSRLTVYTDGGSAVTVQNYLPGTVISGANSWIHD